MSFDFVYEEEWKSAGISVNEVSDARILIEAIFTTDFISAEHRRADNLGSDPLTKIYRKHPLLIYLESPFLSNICDLIQLADALITFKDEKSIAEYISRMKKTESFKASLFELEFATFLNKKGLSVTPGYKIKDGEIDIYIPEQRGLKEILIECKTYYRKRPPEEGRRSLIGFLMKNLSTLPSGFVICFESYVEITEDNLKSIKGKLKSIVDKAVEYHLKGERIHELFFGRLEILYFTEITDEVIEKLRSKYNEVVIRAMVPQEAIKEIFKIRKDLDSTKKEKKRNESILAFELPLTKQENSTKFDYLKKAKSDIDEKIKQHKARVSSSAEVCIVLENIPPDDFMKLKAEIETGLYKKYPSLSILFVNKDKNMKNISYRILPLKLNPAINKFIDHITQKVKVC